MECCWNRRVVDFFATPCIGVQSQLNTQLKQKNFYFFAGFWWKHTLREGTELGQQRKKMIHHMFVFGVVIPTVVTIALFLGFLLCWFKFNMRERLFRKKRKTRAKPVDSDDLSTQSETVTLQDNSDTELCESNKPNVKWNVQFCNGATRQYVNLDDPEGHQGRQAVDLADNNRTVESDQGDPDYPQLSTRGDFLYLPAKCCSEKEHSTKFDVESSKRLSLDLRANQVTFQSGFVQQTFLFPPSSRDIPCKTLTTERGKVNLETYNYGHLVPVPNGTNRKPSDHGIASFPRERFYH